MEVIHTIAELKKTLAGAKSVGFVPTMGALHEGHLNLARRARAENDISVASIFVNPAQFGPNEDFEKYPRTLENDCILLESVGVDFVFTPSVMEMYPILPVVGVSFGTLTQKLCGKTRPTHFQGVGLVVAKLFNIVSPHRAYFGQKDYQQTVIIRKLTNDLNFPVDMIVCPTTRETDGLAMSSRNRYLTPDERAQAPVLYQALQTVENAAKTEKSVSKLLAIGLSVLEKIPNLRLDYFDILTADDLSELQTIEKPAVCAGAIYFGAARLIDNILIS